MKPNEIIDLLAEILENLKTFKARWDSECDGCGDAIYQDDDFCFVGDKQKICPNCLKDCIKYVRELDTKLRSVNAKI